MNPFFNTVRRASLPTLIKAGERTSLIPLNGSKIVERSTFGHHGITLCTPKSVDTPVNTFRLSKIIILSSEGIIFGIPLLSIATQTLVFVYF